MPEADSYGEGVRRWYAVWLATPQSSVFTPSEWQVLHMLAPIVELYHAKPSAALHAEIRVSEAKLGATREDRLRLGWYIEGEADPLGEPDEKATVKPSSRTRRDPRLEVRA